MVVFNVLCCLVMLHFRLFKVCVFVAKRVCIKRDVIFV